jgi:putative ABC transport system permease protein
MFQSYLKLAWKVLWRRRFFTIISLFGIVLTLVVLMVATAILDHIFAPTPPEVRQDRTLAVFRATMVGPNSVDTSAAGYLLLDRYARNLPGVERMAIVSAPQTVYSYLDGQRIESVIRQTDADYWRVLDFVFLEGGPFTDQDVSNGSFVAVISESLRDRFFAGQPAVGRTIEADAQRFRVIGVVPDIPVTRVISSGDMFVPVTTSKTDSYRRELLGGFFGLLLARRTDDLEPIKAELEARLKTAPLPSTEHEHLYAPAETYFDSVASDYFGNRTEERSHPERLWAAIIIATVLFLLLPSVNLVNLNVSRIMERSTEIGVRKAFGASSRVLVGQFVLENLVLTLLGGLVGLVVSAIVLRLISAIGVIPHANLQLNLRVFFYGLCLSVFFGLMSGVYPAWRMSRMHPVQALKGATR